MNDILYPVVGDKGKVDKNCMAADVATFACRKPLDAASYIGIAYDLVKGINYNSAVPTPQGFRGKIGKLCKVH